MKELIQDTSESSLHLRGQRLHNKNIVIGKCKYASYISKSIISDSEINILRGKEHSFFSCMFYRCVISSTSKVKNLETRQNYWEDCFFIGDYIGVIFGGWRDDLHGPCPWGDIALRRCDFSKANLMAATFFNLDLPTITFPSWPCFTILHPAKNRIEYLASGFPLANLSHSSDPAIEAQIYQWHWLAKTYDLKQSEVEIRSILQKLPFIVM